MNLLEKYAMVQAAKRGISPSQFQQMGQQAALENSLLGLKSAELQSGLLQAPEVRASPQVWELLGLRGAPTQGAAGALTGGPAAMEGFARNVLQGRPVSGQPTDLPRQVETTSSVERLLKGAQARNLNSMSSIYEAMGMRGPGQGGNGFQVEKVTPSGPVISRPKSRTLPEGTLGPDGKPIKSGYDASTGDEVRLTPVPGTSAVRGQMKRLDTAIAGLRTIGQPVAFPDGRNVTIFDVLDQFQTPGIGSGGLTGTIANLGQNVVPGVQATAKARIDSWKNEAGVPPAESAARKAVAAQLDTLEGHVSNLVKALGDAGALSDADKESIRRSFLPQPGEPGGTSAARLKQAETLVETLKQGLAADPTAVRTVIAQTLGVTLEGNETGTDAAPVPSGASAPTPAGRSSYNSSDIQQFKTELFGG